MEPLQYEQHLLNRCIELSADSVQREIDVAQQLTETTMKCQVKQKRALQGCNHAEG
jgi:hypothetical protein